MLTFKNINALFVILVALSMLLVVFTEFSIWWVFVIGLVWFIITAFGSGSIQWNYFFKSLNSNPDILKNEIAITFDDGPHPVYTPKVLALLKKHQAKATFFCIATEIEKYPEIFKNIISQGHTVGNHTFSHPRNFGFLSTEKVIGQLQNANELVFKITGKKMKLYRPAFGVTNPTIKKAIKALNLSPVGWNKRSLDTLPISEKTTLQRSIKKLKKGDVILLHDTSQKSVDVLEHLLLFLQKKQMQSVTIDSLFNIPAYENEK